MMMKNLLLASVTLTFATTLFAADSQKVTGIVVDASCAAKGMNDFDCAKRCIARGDKPVLVSDADQKVWKVDNPDALKSHAGEHVNVIAQVDAANKSIHVEKVYSLK